MPISPSTILGPSDIARSAGRPRLQLVGAALVALLSGLAQNGLGQSVVPALPADDARDFSHAAVEQAVLSRARPEFETEGLELSTVLWDPLKHLGLIGWNEPPPPAIASAKANVQATAETEYDDNVFRGRNSRRGDFILRLKPNLNILTDWENGQLQLSLNIESAHYTGFSRESYNDVQLKLGGETEVGEASRIGLDFSYDRKKEARGSIEDPGLLFDPTVATTLEGTLRAGRDLDQGPLVQGESRLRQTTFAGPGGLDRSSDDRVELDLLGRAGWRFGGGSIAYFEPRYIDSMYVNPADSFGFKRNAKRYQGSAGFEWDISPQTYVEARVGYFLRDFEEQRFNSVSGINYAAAFTWNPTDFLTLRGQFRRDIQDVILLNTSSAVSTFFRLGLEYEFLDNLLLNVEAAHERVTFNELARKDQESLIAMGARYLINEYLFAGLRFAYLEHASEGSTLAYTDNRATIFLGMRLCCASQEQRQRGAP